jgi:hypothetical protein
MIHKTIYTSLALLATISLTSAMEMMDATSSMMKKDDGMMMKKEHTMKNAKTMMEGDDMHSSMMGDDSLPIINLGMGSRGDEVTKLQKYLVKNGLLTMPEGVAYGYFGQATKKGIMMYQASMGVEKTGYFGPKTRTKHMEKKSSSMMKKDDMMKKDETMMKDDMMKKDEMKKMTP